MSSRFKAVEVDTVSSHFDSYPEIELKPLPSMKDVKAYQGMLLRGNFSIHRQLGQSLEEAIAAIPENERDALAAYYNGRDLQHNIKPKPSDVVIDFYEPIRLAGIENFSPEEQKEWVKKNFPVLYHQLKTRSLHPSQKECVYVQRQGLPEHDSNERNKEFWWLFGGVRIELRELWSNLKNVLILNRTVKIWTPSRLSLLNDIYNLKITPSIEVFIIPSQCVILQGLLTSFIFELFIRRNCSTLGNTLRFTPTEVFPFFPVPWEPVYEEGIWKAFTAPDTEPLRGIELKTEKLLKVREDLLSSGLFKGLTDLYNHYDNPTETRLQIQELRQAHIELYNSVLTAYGWEDLIKPWIFDKPWICKSNRYVPTEPVRRELLQRIADLNLERYEKEIEMLNKP